MPTRSPYRTNVRAKAELETLNTYRCRPESTPTKSKAQPTPCPAALPANKSNNTARPKPRYTDYNAAAPLDTPAFQYPPQHAQRNAKVAPESTTAKSKPVIRYKPKPKAWSLPA